MQQEQALSLDSSDDTHSPAPKDAVQVAEHFVRQSLDWLRAASDAELNSYIHHCANSMMAAHQRWKCSGNFADVGERDACWHAEADALIERGNRPHLVAKLERERGLA